MANLKANRMQQKAIILIPGYSIEGTVHLPTDIRLTDFINTSRKFIPITDAKLYDTDHKTFIQETQFVQLNKDFIISITPINEPA